MKHGYVLALCGVILLFSKEAWVARFPDWVAIDAFYEISEESQAQASSLFKETRARTIEVTLAARASSNPSDSPKKLTLKFEPIIKTGSKLHIVGEALDLSTGWPVAAGPRYSFVGKVDCGLAGKFNHVEIGLLAKKVVGLIKERQPLVLKFFKSEGDQCELSIGFGPILKEDRPKDPNAV